MAIHPSVSVNGPPWSQAVLSFSCLMILYGFTLAPTVTFEDSGELITAAYHLGVPHSPGYPLYTMISHLFTYLPVGEVAYRVNLVSAIFTAIGCTLLGLVVRQVLLSHVAGKDRPERFLVTIVSVGATICAGVSIDTWRQAVIAEVYGLHVTFTGLLMLGSVHWYLDRDRRRAYFMGLAFVSGLSLTNHPTTILLLPGMGILCWLQERQIIRNWRILGRASLWFIAGLTPLLYLPVASSFDPVMDWGNPETLTNFWRVITRHQYESSQGHTLSSLVAQWAWYRDLIASQWPPVLLAAVVPGVILLFRKSRTIFWFLLVLWLGTGPLTTWVTNFDVLLGDPAALRESKALVSVFYIPSYMILAILISAGLMAAANWLPSATRLPAVLTITAVLCGWSAARNFPKADMSSHRYAATYADNLLAVVPPRSIVLTNWDPFSFPMMYRQWVEGERNDVVFIDQELMRRSWYVVWLRDRFPEITSPARDQIDRFLDAVRPFEDRQPYDEAGLQFAFEGMINALIDSNMSREWQVYLTYDPAETIAAGYFKESVLSAIRLRKHMDQLTPVNEGLLRFDEFIHVKPGDERFAFLFKTYYGRLHYARGYLFELLKERREARRMYERALEFLRENREFRPLIEEALRRMST